MTPQSQEVSTQFDQAYNSAKSGPSDSVSGKWFIRYDVWDFLFSLMSNLPPNILYTVTGTYPSEQLAFTPDWPGLWQLWSRCRSVICEHHSLRAGAGARLPKGCADTTSHESGRGTKDNCH